MNTKSSHVPLFCKVGQIYLQSRFFAYLCNEIERGIAAAYVCEVQPEGLLKTLLIQHTRRFALHHLHDVAASLFLQVFAKFLQVIIIYNHDLATFEKLRLNRSGKKIAEQQIKGYLIHTRKYQTLSTQKGDVSQLALKICLAGKKSAHND